MRMMFSFLVILVLAACDAPTQGDSRQSLAIGDSMFAWNSLSARSIQHVVEQGLGHKVVKNASSGALMTGRAGIPSQAQTGPWTHVLVNGGANDLIFGCNCSARCDRILDQIISPDARSGIVPQLLTKLRDGGAQVSFVGYHRAREMNAPLRHCGPILDKYEARIATFANTQTGIQFIDMRNVFPPGDTSYYAVDRTHPSAKGSATMAAAVLKALPR